MLAAHGEAIGVATNNVAEYRALVAGLDRAEEAGVDELAVVSDSELLVKQMRGEYKVKNAALRELWEEAQRSARRLGVTYAAVRREENELADRLVNEALDVAVRAIIGRSADVAQLVEHLLAMQKVVGSSPIIRSTRAEILLQAEGLERVCDGGRLGARRDAACGLRRRRARRDGAHSRAGNGPHRLGQRRREPDRHGPTRSSSACSASRLRGVSAGTSTSSHDAARPVPASSPTASSSTARRPATGSPARPPSRLLRDSDEIDRQPGGHAPLRRLHRR